MQGLNPFGHRDADQGRPAPVRHVPSRPAPQVGAAKATPRRDPAPSRLAYRLNRMMLRPLMRRLIRVGLPAFLIAMVGGIWLSDETRRANLYSGVDGVVDKVQHRDAFMVQSMRIEGASEVVDKALRAMLPVELPASSFDIDLAKLREKVRMLDAVEAVDLRITPGGVLTAVVTERVPAVLWRHARGLELLDKTGHRVASVTARDVRKDLPIIAGEGADRAAPEAMALIEAAGPILPRLRGLERVGERRWDLVLDNGQRVKLPEDGALRALERVIALNKAQDLLSRDVAEIDLRNEFRPVLQIGNEAQNAIRRARGQAEIGPDGKPLETNPSVAAGQKNSTKTGTNPKKT
ncbi:cell division protein FtsQ/DivIB [Paracoccus litorisediminis]|jgi:cell division protein FtsQ|uniref:Cell division protein FtsQ n=1 Tax=Paracoccus litorisediminis TaxID=2006130 RepID=A0A844HGH0_9RHOB|nr:cell division protein FtsQ/DivIB [Paracoccus litorisediminis]MTH57949.1 cell division protein FtsQ [Paracoccus litorisediminis]